MKVLFITRHYLDQSNGGALGARAYLDAFSSIYSDLTLLYPQHEGFNIKSLISHNIITVPSYDYRSKVRKGLDIYRGKLHRFAPTLKQLLQSGNHYDIVVFDHSILGAELIDLIIRNSPTSNIITIHCNVEKLYNKDNPVNWLYRIPFTHYIQKAEKDALKYSKLNLTVTQEDLDYFKSNYDVDPDTLDYWGTFEYNGMPKEYGKSPVSQSYSPIIVVSGSLNFPQSSNSVIDFLNKYYPIAKDINKHTELIITGRNPTDEIKELCTKDSSITLVPSPDDINAVVSKGNIYCSPVYLGSGVKLRIMDGLKLGMPVLCHQVSAKGYEMMIKGGCMFTYNDEDSFRKSFTKLLNHRPDSNLVYSTYINRFGFKAGCERLKNILLKHNLLDN